MFRNFVLVDIDHTLSNAAWRDDMLRIARQHPFDWNPYHIASIDDKPVTDIAYLINALHNFGYEIVGITSRPEKWREMTTSWLVKYQIRIDHLFMRPENNFDHAPDLKIFLVSKYFGENYQDKIAFVIDDREDVCAAFSAVGITTLQCTAKMK